MHRSIHLPMVIIHSSQRASVHPFILKSMHRFISLFPSIPSIPALSSFVRWLPGCSCLCFSFFVFVRFPVWLLATRPHYQPPPAIHGMIISFIWPTIIHNQLPSIYLSINPSTCRSIHGCPSTQPMCGRSWSYVLSSSFAIQSVVVLHTQPIITFLSSASSPSPHHSRAMWQSCPPYM
jgi:hypothetical protein